MSEGDHWRDWRAESNGLVWRCALPEDMPAIELLWKAKGRIVGNDERPELFKWPVVLTIVAEDGNGNVVDGAYLEAIIDVTKLGASRQGFLSLVGITGELAGFVASRRMRWVWAIFPSRLAQRMAPWLERAGFHERDVVLSHWAKRI